MADARAGVPRDRRAGRPGCSRSGPASSTWAARSTRSAPSSACARRGSRARSSRSARSRARRRRTRRTSGAGRCWRSCTCRRCRGWLGTTAASDALGALVVGSGIAGVGCSVMLYVKTAREWWSGARTAFRFYATAAVLGLATTLVTLLAFGCGPGGARLRGRRPGRAPAGDRLRRQARLGDVDPPASGRQAARVAEAHGVAAAG